MNFFPAAFVGIAYLDATVIHTSVTTDRYGNETRTQSESTLHQCLLKPDQSTETLTLNTPGISTSATIYCPVQGVDVDVDDRIRLDGQLWEIIGPPRVWGNAGLEILVRRWGSHG